MEDISVAQDGTTLLYHDQKGYEDPWRKHHTSSITRDIWISKKENNERTYQKVTSFNGEDRNPIWSNDNQSFYYLSEKAGSFNIFKCNLDGSNEMQLTHHTQHPVRFLSSSQNGLLCYGYDGEIYTVKEGQQPQKVTIHIVTDQTENELAHQIKSSGATDIAVSPNGKEVALYSMEMYSSLLLNIKRPNRLQTLLNRSEASTLLPTDEALYMHPKETDSGRFISPP